MKTRAERAREREFNRAVWEGVRAMWEGWRAARSRDEGRITRAIERAAAARVRIIAAMNAKREAVR